MDNRNGIQTQIVDRSQVGLGGNLFETGLITVGPGKTIKKGSLLIRSGDKFALVTDLATENPVAINPFDIPNRDTMLSADMSLRAIIFGPVRADMLNVNGLPITSQAYFDKIRDTANCTPILAHDISRTE